MKTFTCRFCNQTLSLITRQASASHHATCKLNPKYQATRDKIVASNRIKLSNPNIEKTCPKCGILFTTKQRTFRERQFCSRKCANSKTFSEISKKLISDSCLNNFQTKSCGCGQQFNTLTSSNQTLCVQCRDTKRRKQNKHSSGQSLPLCRSCGNSFRTSKNYELCRKCRQKLTVKTCCRCQSAILNPRQKHCLDCKEAFYDLYRPACQFDFKPEDFPDIFDLSLVRRLGWYSPTNRSNNLLGVSKDHLFSVSDGFQLGVAPELMRHPANCQLLPHPENNSKKTKSVITLDELLNRIALWNARYQAP